MFDELFGSSVVVVDGPVCCANPKLLAVVCIANSAYPPVVWTNPFGRPVEPLVYRINNGSSASIHTHGHTGRCAATRSVIRTTCTPLLPPGDPLSDPPAASHLSPSTPLPLKTNTFFTIPTHRALLMAVSHILFNGNARPPRDPTDAVTIHGECASWTRSAIASALNPANMTEWIAPIRAHANIVMANSGIMGM